MRFRSSVNEKNSTGELPQPINIFNMKKRVSAIKYRSSSKSFNVRRSGFDLQPQVNDKIYPKRALDLEGGSEGTNFWPTKPEALLNTPFKASSQQYFGQRRNSQDSRISRPQSTSFNAKSRFRTLKKQSRGVDPETYVKEIKYFQNLYGYLANILESIRTGLEDVQKTVSDYGKFIRDPYLSFIDSFVENKSDKIRKSVKISRIHEYLSIAYLFLEIAQGRIDNNESYLVNFIGFSLSNLLFTARIYTLLEKKVEFEATEFQKSIQKFQIASYGRILTNIEDVLLRMQHNNQIITMIHKKLGVQNKKFQECIRIFLKIAERKKYNTCLCSHYIFEYLAMHIHSAELVGISQFLEVAPTPYLAPQKNKYTLVIEPLGIIKYGNKLRPYLMQFLQWASKYFDLVMWTWEMPSQVQDIVQILDPYLFSKLYRYHCSIDDGVFTKDLSRLGRDLNKTLIIDYDERIFANTPKNGFVSRWKGKPNDKGLLVMCQVLQEMIGSQSEVEDIFKFYSEELYSIRGI